MSPRDKKIIVVVVPLLVVLGYWFLLLSPARKDAAKAGEKLAKQEKRRDAAREQVAQLKGAKASFASDYAEVVRLGKAIPSSLDMPSLVVQLDQAAKGTGIRFAKIATGDSASGGSSGGSTPSGSSGGSTSSSSSSPPQSSSSSSSSSNTPASGSSSQPSGSSPRPVDAGGPKAQTGYGSATEGANNAAATSNQRTAAAENSGVSPGDAQTSKSSGKGLPVGGGSADASSGGGGKGGQAAPGLDSVPLQLEFDGNFFNLADFFHRLKRFVRVANQRILVHGRLMTVESMKFSSDPETFPLLKVELSATVYLAPKSEGTTAGATPQGPPGTTTSTSTPDSSSPTPSTPTATAAP